MRSAPKAAPISMPAAHPKAAIVRSRPASHGSTASGTDIATQADCHTFVVCSTSDSSTPEHTGAVIVHAPVSKLSINVAHGASARRCCCESMRRCANWKILVAPMHAKG